MSSSRLPDPGITALLRLHLAALYAPGATHSLLERFGSAEGVFRAPAEALRATPGVTPAVVRGLRSQEGERLARDEARRTRDEGIRLVPRGDPRYPSALSGLPQMPLVLYVKGGLDTGGLEEQASVGIVGSRRPSIYGLAQARRFAGGLAGRGLTVVSGLAAGIDGAAHEAALDAGGRTVAVLGSGLARVYPPGNTALARRIIEGTSGVLLSEFPLDAAPRSFHFPMRNRILSGLSAAVLVVEAGVRSGSLITVEHALEQGKSVYAVPGRVDRPDAIGCLHLLRDGAELAIAPEDVLPGRGAPPGPGLEGGARTIEPLGVPLGGPLGPALETLFREDDAWHPDAISERLGVEAGRVLGELGRLELEGRLERLPGGAFARATGKCRSRRELSK